jgi:predicted RNase H-like HicB family nuclease
MKFDLTCIVKKEGNQYSALCLELDVASCGKTRRQAIESLKNAVETYIQYMFEENREKEIFRTVSIEALHEFLTEGSELKESYPFDVYPLEFSYALDNCPVKKLPGYCSSLE